MKKTGLAILITISAIVFMVGVHYYNKWYHQKIRNQKQMYCYDTFWGPANSALIVERLSDGDSLIKYYKTAEQGKIPVGNFPLLGLPTDVPVYVMEYVGKDSSLVDVVNYWDGRGKSRGYYLRGYVYKGTLHEQPAKKN